MPKLSLNVDIRNHKRIFKKNAGIFSFIPSFLIGRDRIREMVEKRIAEELVNHLPEVLQEELENRGVDCVVDMDIEE